MKNTHNYSGNDYLNPLFIILDINAYVEKLVPDQNEYFPANPQIPADLQKFANVRNWFRTLQIAAD